MTLQYTLKRLTLLAAVSLVILLITSNLNGSGGLLTLLSINQVTNPPASAASYRFEPSTVSNLAGGWVTSWDDLGTTRGNANNPKAYTSSWNGSNWSAPTEHRSPANGPYLCADVPLGDLYTYWDSGRNKFLMVATEFGTVVHCIWIRYSTDSTGSSWQPFQLVMKGNNTGPIAWDFPSVTVSQTNGRIVVGASKLVAEKNVGYYTSFSDDGVNWSCPVSVNGPAGGAVSRIVASSSGFHAFVPLDDTSQNMRTLQHWFSTNGTSWSAQSPIATPYGIPLLSSDTFITTVDGNQNTVTGGLSFATELDVATSSTLGWVIAYPLNIAGKNAINIATEFGGGVTITHTDHLFSHGITASSAGDWYLKYQTYQANTNFQYIQEGVVYRPPGSNPGYLGAILQQNIDLSLLFYFDSTAGRCRTSKCFSSGDYFRPAMDNLTKASIPMILGGSQFTNLHQALIMDPAVSNLPQFLPKIEVLGNGANLLAKAVVTPAHAKHIELGQFKFRVSSFNHAWLIQRGLLK